MKIAVTDQGGNEEHNFFVEDNYDFVGNNAIELVGQDYLDMKKLLCQFNKTLDSEVILMIKKSYIEKELDGNAYANDMRANLVLLYQTAVKTEAEIYEIEEALDRVDRKIRRGNWMSAKNYMINHVVVGGALDQGYYDEILTYITDYITNYY